MGIRGAHHNSASASTTPVKGAPISLPPVCDADDKYGFTFMPNSRPLFYSLRVTTQGKISVSV